MAKPNYAFEKRQRERAKKEKKAEKLPSARPATGRPRTRPPTCRASSPRSCRSRIERRRRASDARTERRPRRARPRRRAVLRPRPSGTHRLRRAGSCSEHRCRHRQAGRRKPQDFALGLPCRPGRIAAARPPVGLPAAMPPRRAAREAKRAASTASSRLGLDRAGRAVDQRGDDLGAERRPGDAARGERGVHVQPRQARHEAAAGRVGVASSPVAGSVGHAADQRQAVGGDAADAGAALQVFRLDARQAAGQGGEALQVLQVVAGPGHVVDSSPIVVVAPHSARPPGRAGSR